MLASASKVGPKYLLHTDRSILGNAESTRGIRGQYLEAKGCKGGDD